jgi:hypothetical protein
VGVGTNLVRPLPSSTWQPLQHCCEPATQAPHVLPAWQPNLMPSHVYIMWLSPSHSWWSLSTALVTTCGNPIPIFHKTYSKSSRESGCILALERIMMIQLFKLAYSYFSIWLANFSKLLWPFATADNKINSATANWASVTSPTMLSLPYNHLMILQCDHHSLCSQDYGAFYSCGSPSNMTLRIITSRTTSQGIIRRSTRFVDSIHGPSRAKSWLVTTNLD